MINALIAISLDDIYEQLQVIIDNQDSFINPMMIEFYNTFAILGIIAVSLYIAMLILKGVK